MSDTKEILVYADWTGLDGPCFIGKLSIDLSHGEEVYRFEFSKKWLESGRLVELDPDLSLFPGPLYRRDGARKNPSTAINRRYSCLLATYTFLYIF